MRKNLAYDFTYCVSTLNIAGIASSDDLVLWTEDVKEITSWYPSLEDSLKIKQLLGLIPDRWKSISYTTEGISTSSLENFLDYIVQKFVESKMEVFQYLKDAPHVGPLNSMELESIRQDLEDMAYLYSLEVALLGFYHFLPYNIKNILGDAETPDLEWILSELDKEIKEIRIREQCQIVQSFNSNAKRTKRSKHSNRQKYK